MINANRKINFNAGPAALPEIVLQQAAQAVVEYESSGISILSMEHRGRHFNAILEESISLVKELCALGNEYEVLWLHGGGRLQFCMVPMNFMGKNGAGYIDSGHWASEAADYAAYYGNVQVLASSRESNYTSLPPWPEYIPAHLSYLHFTTNNTIYGTQWPCIPECSIPLIADMSSDIFSGQRDYNQCDLFYAVAQKNIGPAGVTLVAIRRDLLKQQNPGLPPMLSYAAHVGKHSVLNTPPVFAIYTSLLMLRWIKETGIETIERNNTVKAAMLYEEINRNGLFYTDVNPLHRSKMNVCFSLHNETMLPDFIHFCSNNNITGIAGHRTTKGLRVSLYNAISIDDVRCLTEAMREFEQQKTTKNNN